MSPASREPDGDLLSDRRGRQAARRQPAARGFPRPRRRGAVARRSGRRLLGVERGRLRRQAVQVGQPGRRRHQGDCAQGRRLGARRGLAEVATLIAFFKQTLESEIAEARASDRLTDSLACLVAPDFAPDRQLNDAGEGSPETARAYATDKPPLAEGAEAQSAPTALKGALRPVKLTPLAARPHKRVAAKPQPRQTVTAKAKKPAAGAPLLPAH